MNEEEEAFEPDSRLAELEAQWRVHPVTVNMRTWLEAERDRHLNSMVKHGRAGDSHGVSYKSGLVEALDHILGRLK